MTEIQRKQCRDYVLLMLGAPCIESPLEEAEIDKMIDLASQYVAGVEAAAPTEYDDEERMCVIQEGALRYAESYLVKLAQKTSTALYLELEYKGYKVRANADIQLEDWKTTIRDRLFFDEEKHMKILTLLLQRSDVCPQDAVSLANDILLEAGY